MALELRWGRDATGRREMPSWVREYQFRPNCIPHQTGHIMNIEPLHHLGPMRLHCPDAENQSLRDVLGRVPFRDQLQNFALARGQLLERGGCSTAPILLTPGTLQVLGNHHLRDRWAEIRFTTDDGFDSQCQFSGRGIFQEIAGRPSVECLYDVFFRRVHGEDDHPHVWTLLPIEVSFQPLLFAPVV